MITRYAVSQHFGTPTIEALVSVTEQSMSNGEKVSEGVFR